MSLSGWLKESVRPFYLRWLYFRIHPERCPSGFRECWRYPYQKITGPLHFTEPESALPDLIFFPMTDWHTRIQRTQHLVRAFAGQGFRCIYVNPHLGREFDSVRLFDGAHRLARLEENVFELHVRLPAEPVFHDRLLTAAEEAIVAEAIRSILPAVRPRAIQILSFPLWSGAARRFRREAGFPVIYDCHDLLSGFRNIAPDLLAAEEDLLHEADLVLFSSQGLMDRYPEVKAGLLVRNGVTANGFRSALPTPPGPPVVGYVGALDSWFDTEAIAQAAGLYPECRFILAGRVEFDPIHRLGALPNVELAGEIPYEQVPELLARFQVALIPFRINPLTLMTNPIKLYEYFSCGLPVVSSPLPEAQAMGDLVYVGKDPGEFSRQVGQALKENDPSRRARRREIALRENWDSRARDIRAQFRSLLS